jgi:NADH-quinone oxidoreductase subunit B
MALVLGQIYGQMAAHPWVISMEGVRHKRHVQQLRRVEGVDHIVPVDICLPRLPATPEMLLDAIVELPDKIQNVKLGANRQAEITEPEQARLRRLSLAGIAGGHPARARQQTSGLEAGRARVLPADLLA